jgi:hypothetical protein
MNSLAEFLGVNDADTRESPAALADDLTPQQFALAIIHSPEYRASILDRIKLGTLPPVIERWILDTAMGVPTKRVEHTGKDGGPVVTEVRRVIIRAERDPLDRLIEDEQRAEQKPITH